MKLASRKQIEFGTKLGISGMSRMTSDEARHAIGYMLKLKERKFEEEKIKANHEGIVALGLAPGKKVSCVEFPGQTFVITTITSDGFVVIKGKPGSFAHWKFELV